MYDKTFGLTLVQLHQFQIILSVSFDAFSMKFIEFISSTNFSFGLQISTYSEYLIEHEFTYDSILSNKNNYEAL